MKITGIIKPIFVIDANNFATKARQLLRNEKILFVEKDDVFRGIIDRTTALQITESKTTITALDIAKLPQYQTTPDDSVEHIAKKMLKYDTYILPVFEDNAPVGWVGLSEVIAILTLENEFIAKRKLSEIMRKYPIFLDVEDSIIKLWNTMEEIRFSGVPIIRTISARNGKYKKLVGYVSKKDMLNSGHVRIALENSKGRTNPPKIEKVMNRTPLTLTERDTVSTFVERMIENDVSRIPIVNEGYELKGIVGKMDVLKLLIEGKS
ncbi:MAG: CBS domain-containing protein [Candidatus Methanofastidiosia archaeon]